MSRVWRTAISASCARPVRKYARAVRSAISDAVDRERTRSPAQISRQRSKSPSKYALFASETVARLPDERGWAAICINGSIRHFARKLYRDLLSKMIEKAGFRKLRSQDLYNASLHRRSSRAPKSAGRQRVVNNVCTVCKAARRLPTFAFVALRDVEVRRPTGARHTAGGAIRRARRARESKPHRHQVHAGR